MSNELTTQNQHVQQRQQQVAYIPTESEWKFMCQWGFQAIKSGMLPSSIKTPEAAAIIILKGRELGLSFMTSIAHLYVINGKPTMSAELIQGLVRKNLPGLIITILESSPTMAKIEFIRPEKGSKPFVQSYSWEDAKKAQLTEKPVWKQYPESMLWSRCVTSGLRKICPEALMGVSYTPEEMGAEVDQEGNVIETTGKHVVSPKEGSQETPHKEEPKQPVMDEERKKLAKTIDQLRNELGMTKEELRDKAKNRFLIDDFFTCKTEQLNNLIFELSLQLENDRPDPVSGE